MGFLFVGIVIGGLIVGVALTSTPRYRNTPRPETALAAKCAKVERTGRGLFQQFALWTTPGSDAPDTPENIAFGQAIAKNVRELSADILELQRMMDLRSVNTLHNVEAALQEMSIISHSFTSKLRPNLQRRHAIEFQLKLQALVGLCAAAVERE